MLSRSATSAHQDERADFMELFRHEIFTRYCGDYCFAQDNLSRSRQGTLRRLHYPRERPQGKLIQVMAGTIFDVAVDLRAESLTHGQWIGLSLSAEEGTSLWIPPVLPMASMCRANGSMCCTDAPAIIPQPWKPPFHGRIRCWLLSGLSWKMCHCFCQTEIVRLLSGSHLIFRAPL